MANLKTAWTNAWESALTAELSAGSTTITVGDASRLSTPCYLVIDPENDAAREYVLVTFISGNNLTVTRYQADSAQLSGLTHPAGTIIRTSAVAQGFTDLHDRIDALGDHGVLEGKADDDHPQYLNATRHEADAAHPVGTVIKAGSPISVTPGSTISAGSALTVARSDHRHTLPTATPGDSAPGDVASEGTASTAARSDHKHGREAAAAFVGARLWHNALYNVDTGSNVELVWNQEVFDTHAFHDTVTNNSRLTIPAGMGGYYRITGWMFVGGDPGADTTDALFRIHQIRKNGDPNQTLALTYDRPPPYIVGSSGLVDVVALLAAGDYVEYVLQGSGPAPDLPVNSQTGYQPNPTGGFEIVRLGA